MSQKQHGGARPGAGRKWEGHVKYERVSFVAPPGLKQTMDQAASDLKLSMAEVWRRAAQLWLEANNIGLGDD
jgi:hypothetical protein